MLSINKIFRAFKFACLGLQLSNRPAPYKVSLKIVNICNFNCQYCFSKIFQPQCFRNTIPAPNMDSKNVNLILDEAWNLGCRLATFGGVGEVSMHKDFYQHLKKAKKMGYTVNFTTNGWIIDPNILSILRSEDRIRISIDKMHQEGSPVPQKYISRLSSLMKECMNQNLSIIVVKHGESTPEIDKMLKETGVKICNYPLVTSSNPARISYKKKNAFRCIDPWTSICVGSDLTINPCSCTSECVGSIKNGETIKEIWFGDELMKFRKKMSSLNPPPVCLSCDRTDRGFFMIGVRQFTTIYQLYNIPVQRQYVRLFLVFIQNLRNIVMEYTFSKDNGFY